MAEQNPCHVGVHRDSSLDHILCFQSIRCMMIPWIVVSWLCIIVLLFLFLGLFAMPLGSCLQTFCFFIWALVLGKLFYQNQILKLTSNINFLAINAYSLNVVSSSNTLIEGRTWDEKCYGQNL